MLLFVQNSAISDNAEDFSVFWPDKISPLNATDLIHIYKESSSSKKLFYLEKLSEKHLENSFQPLYKLDAAGGMILNEKDELLMIFRKGFWDLPKGKTEEQESFEDSAYRECSEETGLKTLKLSEFMTATHHLYPYNDGFAIKTTRWYKFHAPSSQPLVPQTAEDIMEVKWLSHQVVKKLLDKSYRMIEYLIRKFYLNANAKCSGM